MARMRIPLVFDDRLLLPNEAGKSPSCIIVGSDAWYAWLTNEQNKSFSFRHHLGTFTARHERLPNGWCWYAYRKRGGKLRKIYLGKAEELTLERLHAVTVALNGQDNVAKDPGARELGVDASQTHAGLTIDRNKSLPAQYVSERYPVSSEQAPDKPGAYFCNLPIQPISLIGREREVKATCTLLRRSEVRIVTLTGPGGVGKTCLGLQIATNVMDDFTDGICFVPLASISDAELVIPTIAQTLGLGMLEISLCLSG